MGRQTAYRIVLACALIGMLSACGAIRAIGGDGASDSIPSAAASNPNVPGNIETNTENTIWSIFNRRTADNTVAVNRYIWTASLEVLSFLPVQTVDPFTGVIVTGYGTPPGGGRAYRATVLVDDPALDARSLNVALQTRGGQAVSKATSRAVEDAILSRARELRIADNRF